MIPRTHVPADSEIQPTHDNCARFFVAYAAAEYKQKACALAMAVRDALRYGVSIEEIAETANLRLEDVSAIWKDYEETLVKYGPGIYSPRPAGVEYPGSPLPAILAKVTFPVCAASGAEAPGTPAEQ